MNDDAFHLTPLDIRKQEFRRTVRGYDPAGVDDFRERVAEELERVLRERAQLEDKLKNFHEQLRAFRDRERAMNEALVSAQQLREEARTTASKEAELVVREAEQQATQLVQDARLRESEVFEQSRAAERQFRGYLVGFRALLERQLGELEALESQTFEAPRRPGPAPPAAPEPSAEVANS